MSGHKRATISIQQVDPRRLEEAAERMQAMEKDFQEIQERINHLHKEQLQSEMQHLQERQDHYNRSLGFLDEHLQTIEYHTSQALLESTSQFNDHIATVKSDLWRDTSGLLEQQAQVIQTVLEESLASQQAQFIRIQSALARSSSNENYKRKIALQNFETAYTVLNSVIATYDPNRYISGVIEHLSQELELAHQNISNGFYEAGLLASQQTYQRCSALRLEIENILLQKNLAFNTILAKAEELLAKLELAKQAHAVDLDGNPLNETIDVEYWSWGTWKEMVKECQRLLNLIKRSKEELELDQIALILQQLENLELKIPQLISQSRQNILSSQVRYNLAECIVQALQDQGFFLVESQYQDGDQRQPYQATLKDYSDCEIIVQLAPQPDCPILHTIDLISEDAAVRTQHELCRRASALRTSLQAYGLEISTFESLPEKGQSLTMPNSISSQTKVELHRLKSQ